jgi:tetratricopeptide (TPR) repeat protein
VTSFDSWSLSEEQLLRLGRDALWLERYRDACEALSEYCERLKRYERPISPAILAYYGLALGHSRNVREGLRICREALSQDRRNPNIYLCVGRLYILAKDRKAALEIIAQGLRISRSHRGLISLRESLGVRQAPPIPFLPRRNAVNVKLGKAIRRIKSKGKSRTA